MCLVVQPLAGGTLWTPRGEEEEEGGEYHSPGSAAPALCLHGENSWTTLVPCDPSDPQSIRAQTPYKLKQSGGSTGGPGNYSLFNLDSKRSVSPNEQFGSSGPLPHTRWVEETGFTEYAFDPSASGGSPFRALLDDVIDDDCVGHVTSGGDFCLEASRSGNLEVWAGPLTGGSYVVLLVNRAYNDDTIDARWAVLPSGDAPTEADRARAEGSRHVVDQEGAGLAGSGGFGVDTVFDVRDVWAGKDLGPQTGGYSTIVSGHGVVALILTPSSGSK